MKTETLKKIKMYKIFNEIALKNEIIIFGSTFTADFPFYELAKKYLLSNAIYNRSIAGLTIYDANKAIEDCVLSAKPAKVFYAFTDELEYTNDILNTYKELLNRTRSCLPATEIYILSVPYKNAASNIFNDLLKSLCIDLNIEFIDIDYTKPYECIFRQLSLFFRNKKITLSEAFKMA